MPLVGVGSQPCVDGYTPLDGDLDGRIEPAWLRFKAEVEVEVAEAKQRKVPSPEQAAAEG